jgi:hypothetical protein
MTFKNVTQRLLLAVFLSLSYCSSSNAQLATSDCSTDGTTNFVTGTSCAEDPNVHPQTGLLIFDGGGPSQNSDFWSGNQGAGTGIYNGGSNNVQVLLHGESINGDANWTYTSQIVSRLLQQLTGIKLDGYLYSWEYRKSDDALASTGLCHGQQTNATSCDDKLEISFTIKDSSGKAVVTDTFNYDSNATDGVWYTESGLSWFNTQLGYGTDIASFDISITGGDGGDGGWQNGGSFFAGPQVRRMSGEIIFSQDICAINALHDPACSGYANALFNQQCTANPLYDPACPGYAAALLTQQCTANPLYDPACPGYANAYYTQQCNLNPLYDQGCPGYATASYNQQCTNDPTSDPSCPDYYIAMCEEDPLFDSGCQGYDTAYFNQQCFLDPQYDTTCTGYIDLSGNDGDFTVLDPLIDDVLTVETDITTGEPEFYSVPADDFMQEELVIEQEIVELDDGFQMVEDDIDEEVGELEMIDDIDSEIAKLESESNEEGSPVDAMMGGAKQEDDIEKELQALEKDAKPEYVENIPGKAMPKVDPVDSKRNKMRLLIAMKAIEAVKELEAAVTLEQQMDIQRRLLALISFVPDFKNYNEEEILDLANFYPPKPTVDHAFARWFLNDPKFSMMTDLQYR